VIPGEHTGNRIGLRVPRQSCGAGCLLLGREEINERWEDAAGADLTIARDLQDLEERR
jgi:hypothetical protein